jgi:chemotaxis protein methyltransferase CheR
MNDLQTMTEDEVRPITEAEFRWVCQFLRERTGIELRSGKESVVMGRLTRRLRHFGLTTFGEYLRLLDDRVDAAETQTAIDLLTTNETYFFREPEHFARFRELAVATRGQHRRFRVWSAAASSGEEAYSLAMTLADALPGGDWEVVGTDISTRVLSAARRGLYPAGAAEKIPPAMLTRYCLRGRDEYAGSLLVRRELRERVRFVAANLLEEQRHLSLFDVIFLRNVMIYFGNETKADLIAKMETMLHPGGRLIIGHAETLHGISTNLKMTSPSIYQRDGG